MGEVIEDLYVQLEEYKKTKEEEEKFVFDLLKQSVEKIKKEVEEEKRDR